MSSTSFRPDIQGLRAIAVLIVIAFHYNPAWVPGGFVGVDVFLVISGFLITSILLNKRGAKDYGLRATLKYFYISRFKRIVPAYFSMLIIVALLAAVFFLPSDFDIFRDGLTKAALFASNSYFADFGDYFAPASHEQPLLHTWSLAVEIQFYLLAPFAVLLLPLPLLKWFFTLAFVGLTAVAEYRLRYAGIEQATYYSLYARLPEFFAGSLAALYIRRNQHRISGTEWVACVGLALILLSAMAQPLLGPFPGVAALVPVAGAVLLLSQPATKGMICSLLHSSVLVWVGAISYSLYIWHWPVLAFLRYYTGAEVLNFGFSLLFIGVTLVLSVASYYLIEQGFRAKRPIKKQVLFWSVLVSGVLGTSQVMAKVNEIFTPEQLPIEYRRYADPATICHGKIVGECLRGDLNSDYEVLVLGDSHAAMLNHFFDYLGKELGFKARVITASSCVTIPGFDYERIPEWAQERCLTQMELAVRHIEQLSMIFVAGMWTYHLQSESFKVSLEGFIKNQREKDIFLISQIPRFSKDIYRSKRFQALGFSVHFKPDISYSEANSSVRNKFNRYVHVKFLDLEQSGFFDNAPFYARALIYSDAHHLNEVGSRLYATETLPLFRDVIDQLIKK